MEHLAAKATDVPIESRCRPKQKTLGGAGRKSSGKYPTQLTPTFQEKVEFSVRLKAAYMSFFSNIFIFTGFKFEKVDKTPCRTKF